jgi:orotidine-5'-phosphate decarboxylase
MLMASRYPIIVALDDVGLERAAKIVDDLCGLVTGFKVGMPLLLEHGVGAVGSRIVARCREAIWLADTKLADVAHVARAVASKLLNVFDYLIAHAFVGYDGALEALPPGKTVLVLSMSHPGSAEVIDRALALIASVIEKFRPWGVVAPATRPVVIRWARNLLGGSVKILAPGVGAQGAKPGSALCAGADYEIVGRAVVESHSPEDAAKHIGEQQWDALRRCKRVG